MVAIIDRLQVFFWAANHLLVAIIIIIIAIAITN